MLPMYNQMITRRKFIKRTCAGLFLSGIPYSTKALSNIKKYELTAKKAKHSFEKNMNKTDLWLFNNNCPGPLIAANKNDEIEVTFNNQLERYKEMIAPIETAMVNDIRRHNGKSLKPA